MKSFLVIAFLFSGFAFADDVIPLTKLKVPAGFHIEVFAHVKDARSLNVAPGDRVFVGSREGDSVAMIENGKNSTIASGLDSPNGVAFQNDKLYVAEISRILEFDVSAKNLKAQKLPLKPLRELAQKFPSDTHHGWKFIRFGPDGKLYVPVGMNCNICDPKKDYGRLYRIDVNGTAKEEIAEGIRNTVGFDFDPTTKELWFTDNGRDMLGDDIPPDELNHLTKAKEHFGFPYCHGKNISDPDWGKKKPCSDFTPPVVEFPAHVATLGMRFYTGKMFPAAYHDSIIVAQHGSWNRSVPQGYQVVVVHLKDGKPDHTETLVEGWLQGEGSAKKAWGRPVDVDMLSDGSLLISDDRANVIYRLTYNRN